MFLRNYLILIVVLKTVQWALMIYFVSSITKNKCCTTAQTATNLQLEIARSKTDLNRVI